MKAKDQVTIHVHVLSNTSSVPYSLEKLW